MILAFSSDTIYPLYRHRTSGLTVPFVVPNRPVQEDARQLDESNLPQNAFTGWMKDALAFLKDEFDFIGRIDEHAFKAGLRQILERIPDNGKVVVLETNDQLVDWNSGSATPVPVLADLNHWSREVCREFPNVILVKSSESVQAQSDLQPVLRFDHMPDVIHFDRKVYFRLFKRITSLFENETGTVPQIERSLEPA